jgi:hypothetical protein
MTKVRQVVVTATRSGLTVGGYADGDLVMLDGKFKIDDPFNKVRPGDTVVVDTAAGRTVKATYGRPYKPDAAPVVVRKMYGPVDA